MQDLRNLCENKIVYAEFQETSQDGILSQPLYGQVILKNGHFWVYSFGTKLPKAGCSLVSFDDILSQSCRNSRYPRLAFLEVILEGDEYENGNVVELVINTDDRTHRGENFALLCSGLEEHDYLQMSMINSYSTSFLLDPGPPPVVEGIGRLDFRTSWQEGNVFGMDEKDSWFGISLREDRRATHHKIGDVISGLDELIQLYKSGRNLVLLDSGLIF